MQEFRFLKIFLNIAPRSGRISDDMTCILEVNNGGCDVLIPKSLFDVTQSSVVFSILNPTDNEINLK